ncbi:MAG: LEPR-XLL domain-containing protein [Verrucomicrobiales bacterium]
MEIHSPSLHPAADSGSVREAYQGDFLLEALEPRILLSAADTPVDPIVSESEISGEVVIVESVQAADQESDEGAGDGSDLFAETASEPEIVIAYEAARPEVKDAEILPDSGADAVDLKAAAPFLKRDLQDPGRVLSPDRFARVNSGADEAQTSLNTAHGPPQIDGLELVSYDPAALDGQVFHLDFDGASGVLYEGPVDVPAFDVPGFEAPDGMDRNELIAAIVASLNDLYGGSGVTFTTEIVEGEHSTIYVGGDGREFSGWGRFRGLAESVDILNINRSDKALVFSEVILEDVGSASEAVDEMVAVIAEEAAHLLGYAESGVVNTDLRAVADGDLEIFGISQRNGRLGAEIFPALSVHLAQSGAHRLTVEFDNGWSLNGIESALINGVLAERFGDPSFFEESETSPGTWTLDFEVDEPGYYEIEIDSILAPSSALTADIEMTVAEIGGTKSDTQTFEFVTISSSFDPLAMIQNVVNAIAASTGLEEFFNEILDYHQIADRFDDVIADVVGIVNDPIGRRARFSIRRRLTRRSISSIQIWRCRS